MIMLLLRVFRLLPFLVGGHRQLALENLALRQQLSVYKRTVTRPSLRTSDRLFWVALANWRVVPWSELGCARGFFRPEHHRWSELQGAPSAFSTFGLTSPIISSIERIAALCGVLPTLNEKHTCTGLVAWTSATSFSATVSTSPISRLS